mmetsp:Transcript_21067/g.24247  ORF Transcript_21067/g.24247 Transcript_21067/m.24247 type:complete len:101 (+) Transcript_21067:129-431(+)
MANKKKKKRSWNFEKKKSPLPPSKLAAATETSAAPSQITAVLDKSSGEIAQKKAQTRPSNLDLLCRVAQDWDGSTACIPIGVEQKNVTLIMVTSFLIIDP